MIREQMIAEGIALPKPKVKMLYQVYNFDKTVDRVYDWIDADIVDIICDQLVLKLRKDIEDGLIFDASGPYVFAEKHVYFGKYTYILPENVIRLLKGGDNDKRSKSQ